MEDTIASPITVHSTDDKYILMFDKKSVNFKLILDFLERMKIEYLIEKAGFDESIEEIGEEIKRDWWAKNKEWFLSANFRNTFGI